MTDAATTGTYSAFPSRRFVEEILLRDAEIPLGIIMTDAAGIVTHWNDYAMHLYGWSRDEAIGQSIVELNVGPADEAMANEIMASLSSGDSWSGTFDCRRKDGSSITINILDVPVLGDDGSVVGIVGFSREVVEQFLETLQALDELRSLADRFDEVRREEQQRIAAQLHDHLSQPIAMMATESLKFARQCDSDRDAAQFERIGRTLQEALRTLQTVCGALRPPGLDEFGPMLAIENLLESWAASSGVAMESMIDPAISRLDAPIAEVVIQVLTEALANVERHARATHATVDLTVEGELVTLLVGDDGNGYSGEPGFGIRLMTERSRRVGGRLQLARHTDSRCGTLLSLSVPVTAR